jgi:hypothetical protein
MPSAPPQTNQLFLTALPNGMSGDKLRLSLLLTPSLLTSNLVPTPFDAWPDTARLLQWTVKFCDTSLHPISAVISAPLTPSTDPQSGSDLDTELWKEIFGGVAGVTRRRGTRYMHGTWRVSHNISTLHQRHQANRLAHAYRQISKIKRWNTGTDFDRLQAQTTAPAMFLHPEFQSKLADKFTDRDNVLSQFPTVITQLQPKQLALLNSRVNYAISKLEAYGGAPLSAMSLSALYVSSLRSVVRAGGTDSAVDAACDTVKKWPSTLPFLAKDYPELDVIRHYAELLLFHRRTQVNSSGPDKTVPAPDFHKLLGLVHSYPAIMRPLGLIFDFVVTPPPGLQQQPCSVVINLDTSNAAGQQLSQAITVSPVFTLCTLGASSFYATPRDSNLIQSGLLNLRATAADGSPRFTLVPENADGQSLKYTDQANNTTRAQEYQTSAPTAMNPNDSQSSTNLTQTPAATANPVGPPPAPRTVGLALFDQTRLTQLEQTVGQTSTPTDPDTTPAPPAAFNAEDLILGYRVDVFYSQHFYSLCKRSSIYEIYVPRTDSLVRKWTPNTQMEKSADEGFLSFGATQSVLDPSRSSDDPANTQTQLHQSVFTWSGWSLSVPQPGFPQLNNSNPGTDPPDQKHVPIRPCFSLPDDFKLPPLRFDKDYIVRCRVADLAGNGAPPEIDPGNTTFSALTLSPTTPFSRHEPVRAPQFLLREPIDRRKEPGTHLDRIVVRDGKGHSVRVLVAPRESLRLAELSGKLQNCKLPSTAFSRQQLLSDGAFPSVACAKQKGWLQGDISESGDQDPVFLRKQDDDLKVLNPYYPDPLANYIRVEFHEVTDDPVQSRLLTTKWLPLNPGNTWPERSPVLVRVRADESATKPSIEPKPEIEADAELGTPKPSVLDVVLPKASTVVLNISSAAIDGSKTNSAEFPVHLSHLSRYHAKNPKAMQDALGVPGGGATTGPLFTQFAQSVNQVDSDAFASTQVFVDGGLEIVTPRRTMTLVHAVKQPLLAPSFSSESSGQLKVQRDPGASEAHVSGQLRAHWQSTSKMTCYAEWTDCVDDLSRERPLNVHHREVAFVLGGKDFLPDDPSDPERFRTLAPGLLQHFSDTRSHQVTYSLVASSSFREYYPPGQNLDEFQVKSDPKKSFSLTVASSARPNSLKIAYLIPAFLWTDSYDHTAKTWYSGRRVVLRAYFERGFNDSGNNETVAVMLADPKSTTPVSDQASVSRWGSDPARSVAAPIVQNELTETNLYEPGQTPVTCSLAEGGTARAKPCKIQYSHDRRLWFTDIPIDTQHANSPFVRLALARWQQDSLTTPADLRCSQVTFADFMQVADCRWASVQKIGHSRYKLTISGAFPNESSPCPFTLRLYKRWFALDEDMGWRQVNCKSKCEFQFDGVNSNSVGSWSVTFQTPDSVHLTKYRVLAEEAAFSLQPSPKILSMFINLP